MSKFERRNNDQILPERNNKLEQLETNGKQTSKPLNVLKSTSRYNEQMMQKYQEYDRIISESEKKLNTLIKKDGPANLINHDSHDIQEFHDIEKVFERQSIINEFKG